MSAASRVLLVEDDADLADAYRLVLDARGWEIEAVDTAASALSRLEDDAPDVVVADLGLPDLSGPEMVARLRRSVPDARLVVLTGEAGEATRRRCLKAGADDYLVKPVSGSELAGRLERG